MTYGQMSVISRAFDPARAAALRQMLKTVAGRHELDGDAVRCSGIAFADVGSDVFEVCEGLGRKDYRHFGGADSLSVPQESSQRRTAS